MSGRWWTGERDAILREVFPAQGAAAAAAALGTTRSAVKNRLYHRDYRRKRSAGTPC